jgi:[CysO sulfur-carrier protein]-S-L-cysteine hydrolase
VNNIKIPNIIKEKIFNNAKKYYPKECCGLLIGYIEDNKLICKDSISTKNIAANPYLFFEIDPQEIINIQKLYRKNKMSIIGHYHSHPDSLLGTKPSQKDIRSIYDANMCWIIVGINDKLIDFSAYMPILIKNNYGLKNITIN